MALFSESLQLKQLKVEYAGVTKAGIKPHNQDAFAAFTPSYNDQTVKGTVLCIADGVSASKRAREAANVSVNGFINDYYSTPPSWSVKKSAAQVLLSLNAWLNHQGRNCSPDESSLVTTFSSIVLKSTTAYIFHIGDSRVYRIRNQEIEQLTRDHTHRYQSRKHVLYRAMGMDPMLEVDYLTTDIKANDYFLLTTDGVTGFLEDQQILNLVNTQHLSLNACVANIIAQALEQGSDDNCTCLLVKVNEVPTETQEELQKKLSALVIPPAMHKGNKIDQYYIEEILHSGSRSHVYWARDLETKRQVVLKAPSQNFAEDTLYLQGFMLERWIGQKVNHSSVMKIHNPSQESRFLYHVCEAIHGITLRQWMRENPNPSLAKIRPIIIELVESIRALQRLNIIHRDLKPENIMIDENHKVKLIDFGAAKVDSISELNQDVAEDVPVGTVGYVAPESLLHNVSNHQSDIFSLGVIIYELLTGKLPYQGNEYQLKARTRYSDWEYIPLIKWIPDSPKWLDLTLQKACNANPANRYPAMSEIIRDLKNPNQEFIVQHQQQPLLERNPILFWQICSALFAILALAEWVWITQNT